MELSFKIFFIGPFAVGKSLISNLISTEMNLPSIPPDRWKWYLLFKNGYSITKANSIISEEGIEIYEKYFYNCLPPQLFVNEVCGFQNSIMEIPPMNAYYKEQSEIDLTIELLGGNNNLTFLLLPSNLMEESIAQLDERLDKRFKENNIDFPLLKDLYKQKNRWILTHSMNNHKSINKIYCNNKKIEEIKNEILKIINCHLHQLGICGADRSN